MPGNFRRRVLLEAAGREVPCAGAGARRGFGTERVGGDVPTDRRPGASGVIIGARPMVRSPFFPIIGSLRDCVSDLRYDCAFDFK